MLLCDMYNELNKMGGFVNDTNKLTDEMIEFLDNNNEYNLDLQDLLNIIDDYYMNEYAEICAIFENEADLGYEEISNFMNIPDYLENYIDYEKFGEDLLNDEPYCYLSDGKIAYISL